MDACDIGKETAETGLAGAIAAIRAAAAGDSGIENIYCADCGGEIPEGRRRAKPGCLRCTACQDTLDRGR